MVIVYCLGLALLYVVPVILVFQRFRIAEKLKNPVHFLALEPSYNENNDTVSINTGFSAFYNGLDKTARVSYPLVILRQICTDIEEGLNYNGAWYLSCYKKQQNIILAALCIASHIAPTLSLVLDWGNWDVVMPIFLLQCIWYTLLIVFYCILLLNYNNFAEIFYKNWHDGLLDVNARRIHALKEKLGVGTASSAKEELQAILKELREVYALQSETLSKSNMELAAQLKNLSDAKQKGDLVAVETFIDSLKANFTHIEDMCSNFKASAKSLEDSYKVLLEFTGATKPTINAINRLTDEFSDLRKSLTNHSNDAEKVTINKLNKVCSSLEANASKTFTAIEATIHKNTKELFESYERFFEICKTISSNKNEERGN